MRPAMKRHMQGIPTHSDRSASTNPLRLPSMVEALTSWSTTRGTRTRSYTRDNVHLAGISSLENPVRVQKSTRADMLSARSPSSSEMTASVWSSGVESSCMNLTRRGRGSPRRLPGELNSADGPAICRGDGSGKTSADICMMMLVVLLVLS